MEAKLVRFYGFSDSEVSTMPLTKLMMYWKAIDMLEAQEILLSFKIASFPNMKEDSQKKITRTLEDQAYFTKKEEVYLKTSDIANYLGAHNV